MNELFDQAPQAMWVFDQKTLRFLAVNEAAIARYGWSRDELLAMTIRDIRPPEEQQVLDGTLSFLQESHVSLRFVRHWRKDHTTLFVSIESREIERDGRSARLVVATDVTEWVETATRLRDEQERYRALFDGNPLPAWVFDLETLRLLAVNAAAAALYGWTADELLSMTIRDVLSPGDVERQVAELVGSTGRRAGGHHRTRAGNVVEVDVHLHRITFDGRPARLVQVDDVTERSRAARALADSEARLRQAAKMEAVGSLAGGVAHDFNNVIAVITSVTELMLEDPTLRPEQRADLGDVRQAASRAADLTRKLLAFSRSQALQQRVLDLDEVIADTEKLLRRLVREDIALATSLGAGGARVFADAGQLEQVLLNLVVNACDAMPRGGRLGVETSQVELDREVAARQAGARAGKYVLLSVTDTGSGMAPDVLARAFEPFFTTKAPGKGTGLGLAIVYGVVQQSGGFVRLSSEPGAGTTASVFLPRYEGGGVAAPRLERSGAERGGAETLLVVEDEPAVRAVCRRILEARGYTVLVAANGAEALDLARGRDVDLLVTDLVMPCVGGSELAATLRAERPSLPAIFMSGYAGEAGTLPADVPLLRKPFTPDALARAVRAALDGAAPTT